MDCMTSSETKTEKNVVEIYQQNDNTSTTNERVRNIQRLLLLCGSLYQCRLGAHNHSAEGEKEQMSDRERGRDNESEYVYSMVGLFFDVEKNTYEQTANL